MDISEPFPLFVPAANCSYCFNPPEPVAEFAPHPYNNSLSSTWRRNGTLSEVEWAFVRHRGIISSDTVTVGELAVPDQQFEEYDDLRMELFGWWIGYDGVLGLAAPWMRRHETGTPSFFTSLLERGVLDEPLFSLKFPANMSDQGELLFGTTNPDLYDEESVVRLPVVEAGGELSGLFWSVPAESVTFDHPNTPLHVDLDPGSVAVLDSAWPWIMLPHDLYENITAAVGPLQRMGPFGMYEIPCGMRQELPTMTFGLGGYDFIIDAFDYVLEVEFPWVERPGPVCLLALQDITDFGLANQALYLSHPFLKAFYSIFDAGKKEVGRK